jgi:hypothetical protein
MTFRSKIYFTLFAIFEFIVVLVFLVLTARAEQPSGNGGRENRYRRGAASSGPMSG